MLDRVDDKREPGDARGVHRLPRRTAGGHRPMERRQLDPALAVRGPHDSNVRSHALQPDELIHPGTLDRGLALQLQARLDEEHDRRREILHHQANVIQPVKP